MNFLQFRIEFLDLAGDIVRFDVVSMRSRREAHKWAQDRLLQRQQRNKEILAYRIKQLAHVADV